MIVVTVELWPGGSEDNKRLLGKMVIVNRGTGDDDVGEYVADMKAEYGVRHGLLRNFKRKTQSVWTMIGAFFKLFGHTKHSLRDMDELSVSAIDSQGNCAQEESWISPMNIMTAEESKAHQEGLAAAPDFFKLLEGREDDECFVDGFYNAIWRQLGGLDYHLCRLEDDPQRKANPFIRGDGPWLQFERGWYNAFGYDEFGDPEVEKIWAKTLSPKAVALIKRGEL